MRITPPHEKSKVTPAAALPYLIVLLAVGILFYLFNAATPMYADDYTYCFSFQDGKRIQSVWQIFPSMARHYHTMNGRLVPHFFAQLFLMLGKSSFNVINTFLFLGLGLVIFLISRSGSRDVGAAWLAGIFMLLYWLPPAFGDSYLWLDASATYHLGMLLILLCLLPYWRHLYAPVPAGTSLPRTAAACLGSLLLGVCAGSTSENVSIALLGMTAVLTAVFIIRKNARPWMFTGLLGQTAGYLFMLKSPGNTSRLEALSSDFSLSILLERFRGITKNALEYLGPLLLLFFATLLLYFLLRRDKPLKETLAALLPTAVLVMGTLASAYSMIATPFFPDRAWSGTVILAIASYGSLLSLIDFQDLLPKGFQTLIITGLAVFTLVSWQGNYTVLLDLQAEYDARTESIEAQISQGCTDLYVYRICTSNKYSCFSSGGDICDDADYWTNTVVARYWGVSSVHMLEP